MVDVNVLADFEKMVKLSFSGTGPYPTTSTVPVPSSGHCHSFPPLAPSICMSCKLSKGKERCDSIPYSTSLLFSNGILSPFIMIFRSVDEQVNVSRSTLNDIGRNQYNVSINNLNLTLNGVYPPEPSHCPPGNMDSQVCVLCSFNIITHTIVKNHDEIVIHPWIHGIVESTTTLISSNVTATVPHSQIDQSGAVKVNMYVHDHTSRQYSHRLFCCSPSVRYAFFSDVGPRPPSSPIHDGHPTYTSNFGS
jgi:hypothetical protein